jgi:hypothetical protein
LDEAQRCPRIVRRCIDLLIHQILSFRHRILFTITGLTNKQLTEAINDGTKVNNIVLPLLTRPAVETLLSQFLKNTGFMATAKSCSLCGGWEVCRGFSSISSSVVSRTHPRPTLSALAEFLNRPGWQCLLDVVTATQADIGGRAVTAVSTDSMPRVALQRMWSLGYPRWQLALMWSCPLDGVWLGAQALALLYFQPTNYCAGIVRLPPVMLALAQTKSATDSGCPPRFPALARPSAYSSVSRNETLAVSVILHKLAAFSLTTDFISLRNLFGAGVLGDDLPEAVK